jgi:hypothetical protein
LSSTGCTGKPVVDAVLDCDEARSYVLNCEAVLPYLLRDEACPYVLNWNAEVCCYTLRRGPLGHERIRVDYEALRRLARKWQHDQPRSG